MDYNKGTGILFALIAAISFAFMSIVVKLALNNNYSPIALLFFQFVLGSLFLWILSAIFSNKVNFKEIRKKELIHLLIVGASLGVNTMFYFFALQLIPVSLAIILFFLYPVIVTIFKFIFNGDKISYKILISLCLVFSGVLLGSGLDNTSLENINKLGVLLGICAAVSFAFFVYYYDGPSYTLPSLISSAIVVSFAIVFIGLFYPFFPSSHELDVKFFLFSLGIGILGQVFPVLFLQLSMKKIGSVLASIIQTIELPITLTLVYIFFHEKIELQQIVGIFLILSGILYSNLNKGDISKKLEQSYTRNISG